MEFDKQIYDNVGDHHSTKDSNYEILNVCNREVENEYDQIELKVPHKNTLVTSNESTADSGTDVNSNKKPKKHQIECGAIIIILTFAFFSITVVAISLSAANYVTIQSIKVQTKLEENASREHTLAFQKLMQVTHNLNAQFNATLEGMAEVRNDTYSYIAQLKARLDETQNSTEELNNDLRSLSMQVTHNLNTQFNATQESINQLQNDIYSFVSQQFTTLTARLNETKNSTVELKSITRFLRIQLNDLS